MRVHILTQQNTKKKKRLLQSESKEEINWDILSKNAQKKDNKSGNFKKRKDNMKTKSQGFVYSWGINHSMQLGLDLELGYNNYDSSDSDNDNEYYDENTFKKNKKNKKQMKQNNNNTDNIFVPQMITAV